MQRHSNFWLSCFSVLLATALSNMAIADAQEFSSKCVASIEKATGKYAVCLLAARSRFTLNQQEDSLERKSERCRRTFHAKFRRALRRSGEGKCPTVDVDSIELSTLTYTAQIVADAQEQVPADPVNENALFNQPDNDNTCGIRQLLLAQDELTGNRKYTGDIIDLWRVVRGITTENYPPGTLAGLVGEDMEEKFTKAVPDTYDEGSVTAAHGGPETLPSSAIMASSTLGLRFEKFHLDEASVTNVFGADLIAEEVGLINAYAPGSVVEYRVGPGSLRRLISNPDHYYMIVINNGEHWVGATTRTVNDSVESGPEPSEPKLEGLAEIGVIMEFSLEP